MRDDRLRPSFLVALSAASGCTGWAGWPALMPAAALFPFIWSLASTRRQAAVVAAVYFLAASRGLPQGAANFYASNLWPGILLWLGASTSFVIVHSALWTSDTGWTKPVRYLGAMVATALPPFGITGWAHPVTAAGVLFPRWGWLGLGAMTAGLMLMTTRYRLFTAVVMGGIWLWSGWHWIGPPQPASWQGVDLRLGASLGRDVSLGRQKTLLGILADQPPGTFVLFPESAIGFWTPAVARLWQVEATKDGVTVLAGATRVDEDGYDNVLVLISPDGSSGVLYRERMPVPGSMWQPWRSWMGQDGGARAHFFANPVVEIGGASAAPLICYEQLIVWPVLQSMLYDPDLIIAVGNGWWTSGTTIVGIQRASIEAWARLFDKPLVISFNTTLEPFP